MQAQPNSHIYMLSFKYTALIPGYISLYLLAEDNGYSITTQIHKLENIPVQIAENIEFKD